jgi:hypothetical protein
VSSKVPDETKQDNTLVVMTIFKVAIKHSWSGWEIMESVLQTKGLAEFCILYLQSYFQNTSFTVLEKKFFLEQTMIVLKRQMSNNSSLNSIVSGLRCQTILSGAAFMFLH